MKINRIKISLLALISVLTLSVRAQEVENETQFRTSLELKYKIAKGLKLELAPQIRFNDDLSINKFLLEGGLSYKTFGFLYWEGNYRLIIKHVDVFENETYSKYSFGLTAKESFGDFTPSVRLRYSNYADDEVTDKEFLRYKAKLKYDIPNCKITPFISLEAFQDLNNEELYKMRYSTGFAYKVKKNNYISLNYKLDYYTQEYLNKHIIGVAYEYDF